MGGMGARADRHPSWQRSPHRPAAPLSACHASSTLVHEPRLERSFSVLADMLRQPASERFQPLYDPRWKVVQIDHPGPSLALRVDSTSGPSRDPLTLPGHASSPVVPLSTSGHTHVD